MKQLIQRNMSLFVVIGLHLAGAFLLPLMLDVWRGNDSLEVISMGLVLNSVVLLAAWVALETSPQRIRLPAALTTGTALVLTARFSFMRISNPFDWEVVIVLVLSYFFLRELFGLARIIFGWHIAHAGAMCKEPSPSDRQFGIRHFMIWTAGIAVAMGMVRWLIEYADIPPQYLDPLEVAFVSLVITGLSLPGLFCVGAFFDTARRSIWWRVTGATCIVIFLVVAVIEILQGMRFDLEAPFLMLLFEVSLCGSVLASLAIWASGQKQLESEPSSPQVDQPAAAAGDRSSENPIEPEEDENE